jgi:hypothetical protein
VNDRIPRPTTKVIAAALRHRVLTLTPSDLGWDERGRSAYLGGVIEFAHDTRVHSLVVLSDGSVSLYDSEGHGSLGCGNHAEVRASASALLGLLHELKPHSIGASDWNSPDSGSLRCHLLMSEGRRIVEAKLTELESAAPGIKALYFASQRTIGLIERVQAGQSLSDEIELAYSAIAAEGNEQCWSVGNVAHRLRI